MSRKHVVYSAVLSVAAVGLVACSSNDSPTADPSSDGGASSSGSTSARPTLTASKLQPPSQDNKYTTSGGRQQVVFDPCTWVPDDVVAKLGYDPSTRRRMEDLVAEYTFLTCGFSNQNGALQLASGNISLEENKQRYTGRTQDTSVNGREAVTVHKTGPDDCDVDMRTKAGYLEVSFITGTQGMGKGLDPCGEAMTAATAIEPTIGKEN